MNSNYYCIIKREHTLNIVGYVLNTTPVGVSFRRNKTLGPRVKTQLLDVLTIDLDLVRVEAKDVEHIPEGMGSSREGHWRLLVLIGEIIDHAVGTILIRRSYRISDKNLFYSYRVLYTEKIGGKTFDRNRFLMEFVGTSEMLMSDIKKICNCYSGDSTSTLIDSMDIMLNGRKVKGKRYPRKNVEFLIKEIYLPSFPAPQPC